MSRPVHIVDRTVLAAAVPGTVVTVDGDEGRHAVAVRRLRVGEELDLVDGLGTRALAEVRSVSRGSLEATVISIGSEPPAQLRVTVAQALAKGDRGETAVETMTEVGVDEIVPWRAARSVVRWTDAREQERRADGHGRGGGVERWRRTAREAGKQSRRARFPVIADPCGTAELVQRAAECALALVLEGTAGVALSEVDLPSAGEVLLVVGPEGGVAPEEVADLERAGAVAVRLGPTVLRSSTAGTVAAALVLARSGRWAGGG